MATPRGRSRRPTPKQIAALKYLITESKDGRDLTKRILFFLIDASKGMTRNVSVGLSQDREGYTAKEINEAGHGMSSLQSCNCSTHLDELTTLMGCRLGFSLHYGAYDEKGHFSTYGQFAHQDGGFDAPMRYTFWLTEEDYGHCGSVRRLVTSREELEAIKLWKPGLYPSLEAQDHATAEATAPAPESPTTTA